MSQWVKALCLIPGPCKVDRTDFCKLIIWALYPCHRRCRHMHTGMCAYMHTYGIHFFLKKVIWDWSKSFILYSLKNKTRLSDSKETSSNRKSGKTLKETRKWCCILRKSTFEVYQNHYQICTKGNSTLVFQEKGKQL